MCKAVIAHRIEERLLWPTRGRLMMSSISDRNRSTEEVANILKISLATSPEYV